MLKYECADCGCRYAGRFEFVRRFPDIPDLPARIEPGGTVPAAECPLCGALVYGIRDDRPTETMESLKRNERRTTHVAFHRH
jgi:hypothetical protein